MLVGGPVVGDGVFAEDLSMNGIELVSPDSRLHSVAVRRILSGRGGPDNGNFGL